MTMAFRGRCDSYMIVRSFAIRYVEKALGSDYRTVIRYPQSGHLSVEHSRSYHPITCSCWIYLFYSGFSWVLSRLPIHPTFGPPTSINNINCPHKGRAYHSHHAIPFLPQTPVLRCVHVWHVAPCPCHGRDVTA